MFGNEGEGLLHACISSLLYPRANGAKRRSGRKPGARVTNSARLFTPGNMRTQRSVTAGKFAAAVQK